MYCAISALLATAVLLSEIDFSKRTEFSFLLWLGDRSYSIYLIHYPVQYLVNNSPLIITLNFWVRNSAGILFVLVTSHFSMRLLETGLRKKATNLSLGKQVYFGSAITVIPLIICLLANFISGNYYLRNERVVDAQTRLYPASFLPDCNFNDSKSSICEYLTPGSTSTMMLIGDSHAGHLSMAIKDSAAKHGINLLIAPHIGCSKILINWDSEREKDCALSIERVLEISKNRQVDLLIVSIYIHKSDIFKSLEGLKRLQEHFPKILVIDQTPVFPEGNWLTQGPTLFGFDFKAKSRLHLSEMNQEALSAGRSFHKQIKLLNFETVDLTGLYCGIDFCERGTFPKEYFLDTDHLTLKGAEMARPIFEKLFSQIG